jgi:hypothetical protein
MKNVLRTATRAIAAAGVLALAGGLTATQAHAAGGCSSDCIYGISAPKSADDVSVSFRTTVPATSRLSIRDSKNNVVVNAYNQYAPGLQTFHKWSFTDKLTPGTSYTMSFSAYDSTGTFYGENMAYKTLSRKVTFTIDKIVVTNDSDSVGAGEFWMGYKVGSTTQALVNSNTRSISTGGTWTLGGSFAFDKAPGSLTVKVQLTDDDADYGEFCSNGHGASFTNGSNSCADWATASKTFSLPSTAGSGASGSVSFSVSSYVGFKVYAHYSWVIA